MAAKITEPIHWTIYGLGAWGFWRMRPWMWPWAALYAARVAIATFAWNAADLRGGGPLAGLALGSLLLVPAIALLRSRGRFRPPIR